MVQFGGGRGQPLRRVDGEIDALIVAVVPVADAVVWAVDIVGAPSALLLALLAAAQQQVRYASGRVVSVMSSAFTGEGKTDAKNAHVIAETARLRRDLPIIDQSTDLARNLAVLTRHRADLVADRVRGINRLRDLMTSVFPALEREFDYASCKGALVLVSGYATPDRLRRVGRARLAAWLRARHVRNYAQLADRAVTAAGTQRISSSVLALDARITDSTAAATGVSLLACTAWRRSSSAANHELELCTTTPESGGTPAARRCAS